jgi:cyanophycin synthetase
MTLDLEELEEQPTNKIKGFYERLTKSMPSLYNHRCSEGHPGGFFERVKEGTWMGHVIEHIAIELQTLAGLDVGFGRTRQTNKHGVYNVVFDYETEKAGEYAAQAAVRVAEALISGKRYRLSDDIDKIKELYYSEYLGPTTMSIVNEAVKKGIPYLSLNEGSLIQLGYGAKQKRIRASISSQTSNIAVDIAGDKEETKEMLAYFNLPVPKGMVVYNRHDLQEAIEELGYPLVIKPLDGNQGKGATINVNDWRTAMQGLLEARKYSKAIIVEQYITGKDHRLLVIGNKFVAAALRTPAMVTGDGISTVKELIDNVNSDPRRGNGHENVLTRIQVDSSTRRILRNKNLTLNHIIPKDEVLHLKETANLSTGGTSTDVTDIVHPDNIFIAEQISRIVGLDICGIDIVTSDISKPLEETRGAIIEVNAAPGFRMHTNPTEGTPRNVGKHVINSLFKPDESYSIPIVAVTGTNGKTTTTRLIARMAKIAGYSTGYTNTDGIYINDRTMETGDCSGPASARFILRNPGVEFAVLECARGGILRSGLGFDFCHVGVVLNISDDHLGIGGIDTVEELARAKRVVPESVLRSGYSVLNADDELVYDMRLDVDSKIALFSQNPESAYIKEHTGKGGLACVVKDGYITILDGSKSIQVTKVDEVPITFKGKATFMIENAIAATLAGYASGFSEEVLREALTGFIPSPEQTPGRLNVFEMNGISIMIDYVHNPGGFRAIKNFVTQLDAMRRIGIITGVGDRRDEDIINIGKLSAEIFDELIIRQDKDLRGREDSNMYALLELGIKSVKPDMPFTHIPDEKEALAHAIEHAQEGTFILMSSEKPDETVPFVKQYIAEHGKKKAGSTKVERDMQIQQV